jgi:hypothetical protein
MSTTAHLGSYCEQCSGERRHEVCAEYNDRSSVDENEVCGGSTNYILKCGGCGNVSFRSESWCSEDYGPDGSPEIEIRVYPKTAAQRALPSWFEEFLFSTDELERTLEAQLKEVYGSFDQGAYWLCVMGVRAVLETLMVNKIGDQGSFSENLTQFSIRGFIGDPQRLAAKEAIDAGSAAIHRGAKANRAKALEAIQIAENIIEAVMIQPKREARLRGEVRP